MSNKNDDNIRIVKGEHLYAGAPNTDMSLNLNFEAGRQNYVEGDRSRLVNIAQIFDDERQVSNKYRLSGKITNLFSNVVSGTTPYEPFLNDLYYINVESVFDNNAPWHGYPQYNEFNFIRNKGIDNHIFFSSKSAFTYNWMMYVTYPFENDYNHSMKLTSKFNDEYLINSFTISDGVPYHIENKKVNGKNLIYFYCGFKHNLSVGDWIYIRDGEEKYFEVYEIGDLSYGNEDKVFAIYNYGYENPELENGATGTFRRIIDINNSGETISKYYVRKNKVLTGFNDYEIARLGFENIPFSQQKKLEYKDLTPNLVERISIKEGTQTNSFIFKKDVDITNLRDNNGIPVTELFVTIVNRGYMGWFHNPINNNTDCGLQIGWDFNFLDVGNDSWWNVNNQYSRDAFTAITHNIQGYKFYYNNNLSEGDVIKGDICEFNEFEQKETVLSELYHKYYFNPSLFINNSEVSNPDGYYYKPHYGVKIRAISDYVEKGDKDKVDLIPDYSFFSEYEKEWRWRDIYYYGFIDSEGNGVNHPFLNGAHYPFSDILFLQTTTNRNNNAYNNIIIQPLTDECE